MSTCAVNRGPGAGDPRPGDLGRWPCLVIRDLVAMVPGLAGDLVAGDLVAVAWWPLPGLSLHARLVFVIR